MRFLLAAAGKWKPCPERELFEEYRRRMPWKLELREISVRENLSGAALVHAEGEKLLEAFKKAGAEKIIALDERGRTLSSRELAALIGRWRDSGAACIGLAVGGHAGLDDAVKQAADVTLSLGRATWPHLLMRPLLAEQLYRSFAILSGHPYHRD